MRIILATAACAVLVMPGRCDTVFTDVLDICLAGRGFSSSALQSPYDRLPAAAEGVVREAVWSLSQMSAGMHVDFKTNSTVISTNITYKFSATTMWHFASTGVAGMDLYRWDAPGDASSGGVWRWVGTTVKNDFPSSKNTLVADLPPPAAGASASLYRLNLPMYNAPTSLSIGVDAGAVLEPACSLPGPAPVVHYGTSIAQGAVPSRPGHAFTNAVSRALGRPVLNFGFSGNGIMELSVAKFLVEIEPAPAAFVIDCLPNMEAEGVTNNTQPLVRFLRAAHPDTPIVLAEGTDYGQLWLGGRVAHAQLAKRAALRTQYEALVASGVKGLSYVNGSALFAGVDRDVINPTVGGTHPTDLGMASMTAAWLKILPGVIPAEARAARGGAGRGGFRTATAPAYDAATDARAQAALAEADRLERAAAGRHPGAAGSPLGAGVQWRRLASLTVLGQGFNGTSPGPFNRLPSAAQGVVRDEVWGLSLMSTGVRVAFTSNSSAIALNYTVGSTPVPLWHMPLSGTAGADLFVLDDEPGGTMRYRWVGTVEDLPSPSKPTAVVTLVDGLAPRATPRRFMLHLPLRNWPTADASIGVDAGATVDPDTAAPGTGHKPRRTVVWYGTSIEQGGVASRPGDTYTNILARDPALGPDVDVLNCGYAGNGKDEVDVVNFLVQAPDIAAFVVDCLPNLDATEVSERTGPVVKAIRAALGDAVPIVLVEGTTYGDAWLGTGVGSNQAAKRQALAAAYANLTASGVKGLHYMKGAPLFSPVWGSPPEATPTVGGTHPSSLGHREVATAWAPTLSAILNP